MIEVGEQFVEMKVRVNTKLSEQEERIRLSIMALVEDNPVKLVTPCVDQLSGEELNFKENYFFIKSEKTNVYILGPSGVALVAESEMELCSGSEKRRKKRASLEKLFNKGTTRKLLARWEVLTQQQDE